ncbi:MliC family protein [Psychrobacter sp.]|uniref:MliC family protein n=1 Tax=Psychrobacter sp. TaxID=56811 RepID=UPI0025FC554A|nr:MliC family protein [Psychrobacter sp.]
MKNLLTVLPLTLFIAACASNPTTHTTTTNTSTNKAYDRMAPERFVCEDNATVMPKYSIDGEQAIVTASLPKANWNNQNLTMTIAPSGSGARYVNSDNPNVTYEWHTKADSGLMGVKWANGNEYIVNCERQ